MDIDVAVLCVLCVVGGVLLGAIGLGLWLAWASVRVVDKLTWEEWYEMAGGRVDGDCGDGANACHSGGDGGGDGEWV